MRKRICFVGFDNYPILNPEKDKHYFGGESVQQTLLARAFLEIGYDVSMIVQDHGQEQGEIREGIRVWKTYEGSEGLPIIRFFHPRMTSVWKALKLADADIYYQSCAGNITGIVARYCSRFDRKFIFRLAHDSDCIPGQQLIGLWRDRKIYEYGLRKADMIVAQGVRQVELLRANYGLVSTPVNMAVELPLEMVGAEMEKESDILWVNNLRDFKRPQRVLEIARRLPEYRFTMIGGEVRGFEDLYKEIRDEARELGNIEFLGSVSYEEVNGYFAKAKIFLNTSDQEGFPNSFLQAWVRRTPVISFFDPDGLIEEKSIGVVPRDLDGMIQAIIELMQDAEKRQDAAGLAQKFVLENYAPTVVAKRYENLLNGSTMCLS